MFHWSRIANKTSFFILLCALFYEQANAAVPREERLSNHLTHQNVTGFAQDEDGCIWISTLGGLNKYDGSEYEHFVLDPTDSTSISDDFVFSVIYDSEGNLWAGTRNGLCRYEPDRQCFERYPCSPIYNIMEGSDGLLWLSTAACPISFDRKTHQMQQYSQVGSTNTMWEDGQGHLWAGTSEREGLSTRRSNGQWEKFSLPMNKSVICSFRAADKKWWLGTNQGIVIFDSSRQTFVDDSALANYDPHIGTTRINFICECEPYVLLIGTATEGVYRYDMVNKELTHNAPIRYNQTKSSEILSFYKDKWGDIWIGTYDKGFFVANKQSDFFCQDGRLNDTIKDKFVTRVISGKDGQMWIGTRYDGIYRYDGDGKIQHYELQGLLNGSNDFLEVIYMDSSGILWIAFKSCLFATRPNEHDLRILKKIELSDVRVLNEDFSGTIWAGTWWGLYSIRDYIPTLFNDYPTSEIIVRGNGSLLAALPDKGLIEIDERGNIREHPFSKECDNIVMNCISMTEDSHGGLWVGSYGFGLAYEGPDGKFTTISRKDGLPNNNVLSIIEDPLGDIWASTQLGIVRIVQKGEKMSVVNYNLRGLFPGEQYHEKAVGMSSQGCIYFGGNHGITYFNPVELPQKENRPIIHLSDLKIFNRSVLPGDESRVLKTNIGHTYMVTLSHTQRTISIDYSGIDYFSSNNLSYRYQLDGLNEKTIEAGSQHRRASFSSLAPGRYQFRVWAVGENGMVSAEPATLKIKIKPSPFLSFPAILFYVLFVFGSIYAFVKINFAARLNKKKAEIEHNERNREREVAQMKTTFFSNISHELRTPLSLIVAPTEQLMEDKSINGESRHLVEIINRSANSLLKLLGQLMDFVKLESGGILKLGVQKVDIIDLLSEECDSFTSWAEQRSIEIRFTPHREHLTIWVDVDKIEKVMNNLLSNAIKHTPKGGRIDVYSEEVGGELASGKYGHIEGRFLEIRVLDTGEGMSEESLGQVFRRYPKVSESGSDYSGNGIGLHYTKNLIERHKGRIAAALREKGGMEFSFILPLDEVYTEDEMLLGKKSATLPVIQDDDTFKNGQLAGPDAPVILVVEDEANLREYICQLLSSRYRTIAAEDGQVAWEVIREKKPDLILSDVVMPEIGGYELCRMVKEDINFCHIPVILLTAKTSADDRVEGLDTGADAYIAKPFKTEEVMLTIKNQLRSREVLRQFFLSSDPSENIPNVKLNPKDQKFLDGLSSLVKKEISNPELGVDILTTELGYSRTALFAKIKGLTGLAPNEFIRDYRFKYAARLIREGSLSLSEISDAAGFSSYSYFSRAFKQHFGVSPKDFRSVK